jgi:hypothetical protein
MADMQATVEEIDLGFATTTSGSVESIERWDYKSVNGLAEKGGADFA